MPKSKVRRRSRQGPKRAPTRWRPVASFPNLDSAGLSGVVFPSDITGSAGPSFVGLDLDLVVASAELAESLRVSLRFERRLQTSAAVDLWGFDSARAAAAHIRVHRNGSWNMDMRTAADPLSASQGLVMLDLVQALNPPRLVALTAPGSAPDGFSALAQPSANMQPPPGVPEAIRNLAELEAFVGEPVLIPESMDEAAVRDLHVAAELLRGKTVHLQWEQLQWPMTAAQARDLAEGSLGSVPAVMDLRRAWTVDFKGGRRYEVPVSQRYRSVRIARWPKLKGLADDAPIELQLVAADKERAMDLYFDSAAGRKPTDDRLVIEDDPVTTVPPLVFDELAASLDVAEEPSPALASAAARLRALRA